MIIRAETDMERSFSAPAPLYLPFYNRWGQNAYYKYEPFSLNPFTIPCSSTSGSPVVLTGSAFYGFLTDETDGVFSCDGRGTLTVRLPAGQSLYVEEGCDPFAAWERYNALVTAGFEKRPSEPFWSGLEYCTWVDQKHRAAVTGEKNVWKPLCEDYVYDYMRRIDRIGLPHGKLTIDDGWDVRYLPDGGLCYGEWQIDRDKFPHMERLVKDMTAEGFYPGLWFAPFLVTPCSTLGRAHPELIGGSFDGGELNEQNKRKYLHPSSLLEGYYERIFTEYVGMGFKKFKLDIAYGPKNEMKELLRMIAEIIRKLDPTVEIECHVPDVFVSRFCDTVRINDVNFDPEGKWRGVTVEHYRVCRYSAAGKTLNLDHVGTNTPVPDEKDFFEHAGMLLAFEGGYPCVSLLPDAFGADAEKRFAEMVNHWCDVHPTKG